jgi:SAM-dependent methyltransferase
MTHTNHYLRESCRMCNSNSLVKAMSLTPTPPGNDFLAKSDLGREEQTYPLDLYFCEECHHMQLGHVVNPKILYQKNYSYVSSTSAHFVNHLKHYAKNMFARFDLKPGDLAVDIGSNDGTCLSFFKDKGMKVVGVDPATEIAEKATENGIDTIADFFGYGLAVELQKKYGKAKYITSHNACAHIDNLFDVVKGVEHWLDEDGVFVLEVGYFVDVYSNTWFDTVYHEHVDYHTVAPFEKLFNRVGMELISVERILPQGGSIRVMVQKKGGFIKRDDTVDELIALEAKLGLDKVETLHKFNHKISQVRDKLHNLIYSLKADGKSIAGFGAPTKATTLMAHFGLDATVLDFIVDDNPLKQGLFTPITHIPVLSPNALYKRKPDYVLILAWNFAEPIMQIHKKYSEQVGQFILPMPNPEIIL